MSKNVFSAAATSKVEELEKTLKDREVDLAKAKSAAVQAVDKAKAAEDRADEAEAKAKATETEATEAKKKLAGAEARANKAEAEATEAKKKLAEVEKKLAEAEKRLAEAEAKATKAKAAEVEPPNLTPEESSQLEELAEDFKKIILARDEIFKAAELRNETHAAFLGIQRLSI